MFKAIGDALSRLYNRVMPAFWLRLKPRYQWAGGIAVVVALWIATGVFGTHATPSEATEVKDTGPPRVSVATLVSTERDATIKGLELARERQARAAAESQLAASRKDVEQYARVQDMARGTVITISGGVLFQTGKWDLKAGAMALSTGLLAATALIFGAAYTLWMVKRVYFGAVGNDHVKALSDINAREFLMLGLLAAAVLYMGVYPKPVTDVMNVSVADFLKHVAASKLQ